MSYATCISVRQYNSKEEKEKVHALAFSKLIEYIYYQSQNARDFSREMNDSM